MALRGRSHPMCVVRDAWTLRTTHIERVETLAPPPLSMVGINGPLFDLAGDAVPVPIQLFTVSRIAPMQGGRTRLLRLLAVRKVRALLLRLLSGRGSRCATAGLRRRLWCRLGLPRRRWCRRLRRRGLRRRNRRRRRTRGRGWGGTRSRRRRGSWSRRRRRRSSHRRRRNRCLRTRVVSHGWNPAPGQAGAGRHGQGRGRRPHHHLLMIRHPRGQPPSASAGRQQESRMGWKYLHENLDRGKQKTVRCATSCRTALHAT